VPQLRESQRCTLRERACEAGSRKSKMQTRVDNGGMCGARLGPSAAHDWPGFGEVTIAGIFGGANWIGQILHQASCRLPWVGPVSARAGRIWQFLPRLRSLRRRGEPEKT